jgi:Questin oxidase-like
MLNRLLAGVTHPFIHLSYGFEFGILGQVAEGARPTHLSIHFPIN